MSDEKVENKQIDLPLDSLDTGDAEPASVSGSESVSPALGSNSAAAGLEVGQSPSAPDRPWNFEQIESALEVSKCEKRNLFSQQISGRIKLPYLALNSQFNLLQINDDNEIKKNESKRDTNVQYLWIKSISHFRIEIYLVLWVKKISKN